MALLDDDDNNKNAFNNNNDNNLHNNPFHMLAQDDHYSSSSSTPSSSSSSSSSNPYPLIKKISYLSLFQKNEEEDVVKHRRSTRLPQESSGFLFPKMSQVKIPPVPFCLTPPSRKDLIIRSIAQSTFHIDRHYIPFRHIQFFPIGCTSSHAFGVIKQTGDGAFYPIVMHLGCGIFNLPYDACRNNNRFTSPWRKRLEGFDSYLGGCAFNNLICLITHESVVILNNEWCIQMLDNSIFFKEVSFCVMNHEFLVIVGMIHQQQRLVVYRWYQHSKPIIKKNIKVKLLSVKLVLEGKDTLLFTNVADNKGFTSIHRIKDTQQGEFGSFIVLDEGDDDDDNDAFDSSQSFLSQNKNISRWSLIKCNNFTLASEEKNVLFSKMINDGTLIQVTDSGVNARFLDDSLYSFPEMCFSPVDVISYHEGIYVVHDRRNSLRFYDMFDSEITVVKSEDILAPMLSLKCKIPTPIEYYYDSISLCSNKNTIALLLTSGCLCFISI